MLGYIYRTLVQLLLGISCFQKFWEALEKASKLLFGKLTDLESSLTDVNNIVRSAPKDKVKISDQGAINSSSSLCCGQVCEPFW